ncbi:MAG: DNA polymerase III subunit epsilon [Alphaproteobacteria bacterium MarineAlpha5_Bin12]|nr:DNA polymerase III subunit epsilon [Pelagibacteraceae bacterium]PPR40965.1 MAG: DNA polymerase III subunit epsilon [Alphaproteobacteria bacterium MarineAlpha5_Bin12]|tara:strand:- start:347 stop:1018 length:672 start_codon:yes stop_codon:yes gene_type:complete
MREIILDTETTGLSVENGDRVIEIGCIELLNHMPTGNTLQIYFNPETKKVSDEAIKIHKLDNDFLKKQPFFRDKVDDIMKFLSNDTLIMHNAQFDTKMINNELNICSRPPMENHIIDTLSLARKKFGSGAASLDALCKKFDITKGKREVHGALLDSFLLAEVYVELLGGRQQDFEFSSAKKNTSNKKALKDKTNLIIPTKEEIETHKNFIKSIKNSLWAKHEY